MLFTTDRQTLDDLNIFGRHGSDCVYTLYNQTRTRGGAMQLDEMFRHPLSDEEAINRRSGIIAAFAKADTVFPFDSALFDALEPYLNSTDERTRLDQNDRSLSTKLNILIGQDAEAVRIYKGARFMISFLKELHSFIDSPAVALSDDYRSEKLAIAELLRTPGLDPVWKLSAKEKVPDSEIPSYDTLFRFRLRKIVGELLRYVYQLDVYLAVASVSKTRGFVFAKALPSDARLLQVEDVYHPMVKNAIPNSLQITPKNNVIFLTGANMAGKSTFMKSLSIALFVAHIGFPVAASQMNFSVLDGLYTTINLPDNLGMGTSHFYAEVLRVKKMAAELQQGKNLFILFDELFRGTNVKDAYDATIACTEAFATKRNSLFVISTHIIEAGEILKQKCDNIDFVFLPTIMKDGVPVYTYRLQPGITADRHGMVIINNEGILDILRAGLDRLSSSNHTDAVSI